MKESCAWRNCKKQWVGIMWLTSHAIIQAVFRRGQPHLFGVIQVILGKMAAGLLQPEWSRRHLVRTDHVYGYCHLRGPGMQYRSLMATSISRQILHDSIPSHLHQWWFIYVLHASHSKAIRMHLLVFDLPVPPVITPHIKARLLLNDLHDAPSAINSFFLRNFPRCRWGVHLRKKQ